MKLFEEKVEKKESIENQRFRVNYMDTIKGFMELVWRGKKPYLDTRFFPAQLKERYGEEKDGWINKIFWGDNLQVMAHLLREYRGKVKLIYIDPPFDSKADYKKTIQLKGEYSKLGSVKNDQNTFEEKQYSDIWNNGEYLQFMYERLILLRELLADNGSIYLHCDWHKSHHLRCLMDEVFGADKFINEIIWGYEDIGSRAVKYFKRKHDTIFMYTKLNSEERVFNIIRKRLSESTIKRYQSYFDDNGKITYKKLKETNPGVFAKLKGIPENLDEVWLDIENGAPLSDWWTDISALKNGFSESTDYPTQKPEALLERIIKASSNSGDLVFDCFMGSGTTQAVAMKLGRKFIGTDINMGAIQTTTKRLLKIAEENRKNEELYTGFEYYHVNNYDFFRNPIQAKEILLEAYEIEKFDNSNIFDGQKEGRMIKIMSTNRITTKGDLETLVSNLNYKVYEQRRAENPLKPVESITLICMGHESDLKASFEEKVKPYKIDLKVVNVLKDRMDINFERDSEADVEIQGNKLVINSFYPRTLLDKLGEEAGNIEDWRVLVESILIDWNYDGAVLEPSVLDTPDKKSLVAGEYEIPEDYGTIRVKITDLLSNSLEVEVKNG